MLLWNVNLDDMEAKDTGSIQIAPSLSSTCCSTQRLCPFIPPYFHYHHLKHKYSSYRPNCSDPGGWWKCFVQSPSLYSLNHNYRHKWSNHHYTREVKKTAMCECTQEPFHYSNRLCTPLIPHKNEVHIHGLKEDNSWVRGSDICLQIL